MLSYCKFWISLRIKNNVTVLNNLVSTNFTMRHIENSNLTIIPIEVKKQCRYLTKMSITRLKYSLKNKKNIHSPALSK